MALNNPYALNFDGADDYTSCPQNSLLNVQEHTVEFWLKWTNSAATYQSIFNLTSQYGSSPAILVRIVNGHIQYYMCVNMYSSVSLSSKAVLNIDTLYHIACVYNKSYMYIYINGVLDNSLATAHTVCVNTGLRLGNFSSQYLSGVVDELRFWKIARTEEEINSNKNKILPADDPNLVLYYNFDTGSGSTVYDLTPNGLNSTITGATWVPGEVDLTESELPGEVLLSAYLAGGASMSANTIRGRGLSASLSAGSTLSSTLIRTRGLSANLTAGAELSAKMNLIASLASHLTGGATLHAGLLRLIIYEGIYEITKDDYFTKSQPAKSDELANVIKVYTNPLQPASTPEEVYKSNDPISIDPGTNKTTTIFYNEKPVIEAVASLTESGPNLSITNATYYAWGADVTVTNAGTAAETCKIVVNGKPLRVQGRQLITKQDDISIQENGRIEFEFPDNPLVQTPEMAEKIATKLLAFAIPRRDVELVWRGNPALTLADVVQIPEYQKGLVDKRGLFYITRQQFEFDGGLRVTTEGRKIK